MWKQWKTVRCLPGKSLWRVWNIPGNRGSYAKTPILAELSPPAPDELVARQPRRGRSEPRRATPSSSRAASFQSFWAPPAGSGTIPSIDAELEAVRGIGLEGGGGLPAPRRRRATGSPRSPRARSPSRSRSPASARGRRARSRSRRPSRPRRSRTRRSAPAAAPSAPASARSRRPGRAARRPRPGRRPACRRG